MVETMGGQQQQQQEQNRIEQQNRAEKKRCNGKWRDGGIYQTNEAKIHTIDVNSFRQKFSEARNEHTHVVITTFWVSSLAHVHKLVSTILSVARCRGEAENMKNRHTPYETVCVFIAILLPRCAVHCWALLCRAGASIHFFQWKEQEQKTHRFCFGSVRRRKRLTLQAKMLDDTLDAFSFSSYFDPSLRSSCPTFTLLSFFFASSSSSSASFCFFFILFYFFPIFCRSLPLPLSTLYSLYSSYSMAVQCSSFSFLCRIFCYFRVGWFCVKKSTWKNCCAF